MPVFAVSVMFGAYWGFWTFFPYYLLDALISFVKTTSVATGGAGFVEGVSMSASTSVLVTRFGIPVYVSSLGDLVPLHILSSIVFAGIGGVLWRLT